MRVASLRGLLACLLLFPLVFAGCNCKDEQGYQAGFQKDDSATILQVVHNPSFLAPYVACVIVAAGLLVQFGYHLVGFARRRRALA